MSYSQSKKLTDTEKRLQTLKTQLFGKEENRIKINTRIETSSEHKNVPTFTTTALPQSQDLTYLRKDLLKILILATLAIGTQLILYMQFGNRLFKF